MEKIIYKPVEAHRQIRKLYKYVIGWNNRQIKLSEEIRTPQLKTAELLIKIAIQKHVDFVKQSELMKVEAGEGSFEAGFFFGNGAAIAKTLQLKTPRSLDNHLKRLKKAKIAASFPVPENGTIRRNGKKNETLFALNKYFFTL